MLLITDSYTCHNDTGDYLVVDLTPERAREILLLRARTLSLFADNPVGYSSGSARFLCPFAVHIYDRGYGADDTEEELLDALDEDLFDDQWAQRESFTFLDDAPHRLEAETVRITSEGAIKFGAIGKHDDDDFCSQSVPLELLQQLAARSEQPA